MTMLRAHALLTSDPLLRSLATQVEVPRPKPPRAKPIPHAAWKDLAIQIRAHMRDGRSIAAAGGLLGVTADKARRILAAWPLSKLGKTS